MCLKASQTGQLREGSTAIIVLTAQHTQSDKNFICMQARIVSTQVFYLRALNRLNKVLRYELEAVVDACKVLGGVEAAKSIFLNFQRNLYLNTLMAS